MHDENLQVHHRPQHEMGFVVMRKEDAPAPRTWDELYALAEGAGDDLVLPPRDREPARPLQLGDNRAADQSD